MAMENIWRLPRKLIAARPRSIWGRAFFAPWGSISKTAKPNKEKRMVILITGASHTGKTLLAQRLLEKYKYPYLSLDLLKMGLIRSKNTSLTPEEDDRLTDYIWPIAREIVKTAIENGQNLIVEGCYIPGGWEKDFSEAYLQEIRYCCLIMRPQYITQHFSDIMKYANVMEQRMDDSWCTKAHVLADNASYYRMCQRYGYKYIWIADEYKIEIDI